MPQGIGKKSWLGVAREATPGTAVATPTLFMPAKSKFTRHTKFVYTDEDRNTRDGNNDRVGTVRYSDGDLSGAVYLNDFGYLLLGFMGTDVVTQPDAVNAPTGFSHALALADLPPSLTLYKGVGGVAKYQYPYSVVEKIKLKFSADGKLLEHQTSTQGFYEQTFAGVATPAYATATKPLGGYAASIKFGGVASTIVTEAEIDLEQKITLYFASQGDSTKRDFTVADFGERKAMVSFKARFDDTTIYDKLSAETDESVEFIFTGNKIGTGPSTVVYKLDLTFPIVGYDEIETEQKEYVELSAKGTARPGAAVNSLFSATLVNETADYSA